MRVVLPVLLAGLALCGCGDPNKNSVVDGGEPPKDGGVIDAPSDGPAEQDASVEPMRLEDTGLYSDFSARTLAEGVQSYEPAFPLWSDGIEKKRYFLLPEGETIDTSDMDFWDFPEGTKMWKEFSQEGTLLETRLLWKNGPNPTDWFAIAFAWNAEQDATMAAPFGIPDALGTNHDIPQARDCQKCHERQATYPLGVSAIQLDHDKPGANLGTLIADGSLSAPPIGKAAPYFPLPGSPEDQAVLGYMHSNCGSCHHAGGELDTNSVFLRLLVGNLGSVAATETFTTTVGLTPQLPLKGATSIIEAGNADASALIMRMELRGELSGQMPQLATEVVDTEAVTAIRSWIDSLPSE